MMCRPRYRELDCCGMGVEVGHLGPLMACGACVETSHNSVWLYVFVFDYQRDTLGRLWMVADSAAFLGIDGNMRHLRASPFSILALLCGEDDDDADSGLRKRFLLRRSFMYLCDSKPTFSLVSTSDVRLSDSVVSLRISRCNSLS